MTREQIIEILKNPHWFLNGKQFESDFERIAVEKIYSEYLDSNYFPQDDGSIKDCDGNTIAWIESNSIEYDGGSFIAEEI